MCKKTIGFGIMILFITLCIIPLTVGSKLGQSADNSFEVQMIDDSTMEILVNVPAVSYGIVSTKAGAFASVEIPEEGITTTIGEATLPMMNRMVEIPQGATPDLVIESTSWQTTSLTAQQLPSRIIPVQEPIVKVPGAKEKATFVLNSKYYDQNVFTPNTLVKIGEIGEIRSHRFALIQLSPVQYNPATGELRVLTSCKIRMNLPGSDFALTTSNEQRYASAAFDDMLQQSLVNYDDEQGVRESPKTQIGLLVIVYDSFYEEIQPLVTWKQSNGFTVTVTKTSQIPGGPTTVNIKNYITTAYNQWNPPPSYVLLVGDTAQIPTYTGTQTGTCTDLYYGTITQPDYIPDIYISRFPAATESQVTVMVDKTLYYVQGNFDSNTWIKKAVFMASNDNYPVSEGTHNYVINTYLIPHGYTCDKLYCHTYGATSQQVRNALNNGRSLAIFSGHGDVTYWADGPVFYQSDVNGLTNLHMYPFVCSHACLTGQFSYAECFGETWLRAPNKGGIAFWGASTYSYWNEDDILEKKMFSAWWDENLESIGGMTDRAKVLLYQYYGGGGSTKYYFEEYNVLGDSSVKIWRDTPANTVVDGNCYYQNMSPVNPVSVEIINLNTAARWQAATNNNHYTLQLSSSDVSAGQTLRFIARDNSESVNVTDHVVSAAELSNRHISQDMIVAVHYRDLRSFPFYQATGDSGAAVAQMMLNYLWWNSTHDPSGPPLHFADQNALFIAFNQNMDPYLNTDEMRNGLNQYRPLPVDQYGYFFDVSSDTSASPVLQQICIWLDYSMDFYNQYHSLPWPKPGYPNHVPIAFPSGGNYNNWMTIRGIHTNGDAWQSYPDFPAVTVYGFWLNDPKSGGLGANTYVTANQFATTYFRPISVIGDTYTGKYVAVIDPPQGISVNSGTNVVTLAETAAGFTSEQAKLVQTGLRSVGTLRDMANNAMITAAQSAVKNVLKYDSTNLLGLFEGSHVVGKPWYNGDTTTITFNNGDISFIVQLSKGTGGLKQFSVQGL